jgi:hypothetical protein
MGYDSYNVQVDGVIVAEGMPIEHALIFVKALFMEWHNEPSLSITVERENANEKHFDIRKDSFDFNSNIRADQLRKSEI